MKIATSEGKTGIVGRSKKIGERDKLRVRIKIITRRPDP